MTNVVYCDPIRTDCDFFVFDGEPPQDVIDACNALVDAYRAAGLSMARPITPNVMALLADICAEADRMESWGAKALGTESVMAFQFMVNESHIVAAKSVVTVVKETSVAKECDYETQGYCYDHQFLGECSRCPTAVKGEGADA